MLQLKQAHTATHTVPSLSGMHCKFMSRHSLAAGFAVLPNSILGITCRAFMQLCTCLLFCCFSSLTIASLHQIVLMQDTPDGSYAMLEKKGKKQKANLLKEMINGLTNYRIWLLAACYAYSFGVEVGRCYSLKPSMCVNTYHNFVTCHICLNARHVIILRTARVCCMPSCPVNLCLGQAF